MFFDDFQTCGHCTHTAAHLKDCLCSCHTSIRDASIRQGKDIIMACCPNCKRHFRTLEDEEGMHACPSCGFDGHEDESVGSADACNVCGLDISSQGTLISLEGYCGLSCYWQEFEELNEPADRILSEPIEVQS